MSELDYREKQYLGMNRFGLIRRMVITIFCFVFYFVANEHDVNRDLFFYLGMFVLSLSALAVLMKHTEIIVKAGKVRLVGPMTFKEVEFNAADIEKCEVIPYSRFLLNRPIFNLHRKGQIKFFTHGRMALLITFKDGTIFRLGTQRPDALRTILSSYFS